LSEYWRSFISFREFISEKVKKCENRQISQIRIVGRFFLPVFGLSTSFSYHAERHEHIFALLTRSIHTNPLLSYTKFLDHLFLYKSVADLNKWSKNW